MYLIWFMFRKIKKVSLCCACTMSYAGTVKFKITAEAGIIALVSNYTFDLVEKTRVECKETKQTA